MLCDPQIMAVYYEDLVGTGPGYNLLLHYGYDPETNAADSFVTINVNGTETGEYPIGVASGEAGFLWQISGEVCLASQGSLTVSSVGNVGETIDGELDITEFSGTGDACPEALEGSFTMTVVDSSSLTDP
jgi:hypothetical protein